jgi:hypothetical protein
LAFVESSLVVADFWHGIGRGRAEAKLGALLGRFGPYFARVEPLRQAGKYLRGLLSDLQRKNCWTLAEYARDQTPDRMQRLLERAHGTRSR